MSLSNTATTLAFEVIHLGDEPTPGQLTFALIERIADLLDDQAEFWEAAWDPFDSYDTDVIAAYTNGIDPTPDLSAWEIRTLVRTIRQITNRKKAA